MALALGFLPITFAVVAWIAVAATSFPDGH
jgi:hypothetical protein